MRFGSVCSGIEAASAAWHPLGWEAAWFSEIEPFPSRVLAHRWPGVPNLGDMTAIAARVRAGEVEAPEMLVGGTPCQAFSVAGLRRSLEDDRGNLALAFVRLADAIDAVRDDRHLPRAWILWENVPGVLSVSDNAFGALLGGLVGSADAIGPGPAGWTSAGVVAGPLRVAAWRILDAQHFGVAQRRRRVFVLARGGPRAWSAADALLPVVDRLRWDSAPSRAPRAGAAGGAPASAGGRRSVAGWSEEGGAVAAALTAHPGGRYDLDTETFVSEPMIPEVAGPLGAGSAGKGWCDDLERAGAFIPEPIPFDTTQITSAANRSAPAPAPAPGDPAHPLAAGAHPPAIAFHVIQDPISGEVTPAMGCGSKGGSASRGTLTEERVRRLTPRECERLQGFPDDYTLLPGEKAEGQRYRALGNSMAVPVMQHIGRRIDAAERDAT